MGIFNEIGNSEKIRRDAKAMSLDLKIARASSFLLCLVMDKAGGHFNRKKGRDEIRGSVRGVIQSDSEGYFSKNQEDLISVLNEEDRNYPKGGRKFRMYQYLIDQEKSIDQGRSDYISARGSPIEPEISKISRFLTPSSKTSLLIHSIAISLSEGDLDEGKNRTLAAIQHAFDIPDSVAKHLFDVAKFHIDGDLPSDNSKEDSIAEESDVVVDEAPPSEDTVEDEEVL